MEEERQKKKDGFPAKIPVEGFENEHIADKQYAEASRLRLWDRLLRLSISIAIVTVLRLLLGLVGKTELTVAISFSVQLSGR